MSRDAPGLGQRPDQGARAELAAVAACRRGRGLPTRPRRRWRGPRGRLGRGIRRHGRCEAHQYCKRVDTPANWKQGEDVIVTAAVSDADAVARFGAFERILP